MVNSRPLPNFNQISHIIMGRLNQVQHRTISTVLQINRTATTTRTNHTRILIDNRARLTKVNRHLFRRRQGIRQGSINISTLRLTSRFDIRLITRLQNRQLRQQAVRNQNRAGIQRRPSRSMAHTNLLRNLRTTSRAIHDNTNLQRANSPTLGRVITTTQRMVRHIQINTRIIQQRMTNTHTFTNNKNTNSQVRGLINTVATSHPIITVNRTLINTCYKK